MSAPVLQGIVVKALDKEAARLEHEANTALEGNPHQQGLNQKVAGSLRRVAYDVANANLTTGAIPS